MIYKGKTLILDNFRSCLSKYSVDIQDIVRSAILDGVDISNYISQCKENPYRLDQIRLAMKEGLTPFFYNLNGEVLYQIRKMNQRGVNLKEIERQLESGLSEEHVKYLLKWISEGISLNGLTLSIIPKELLGVFDIGLHSDVNMSVYNTGVYYSPELIRYCIQIQKNGHSVQTFLTGNWKDSIVKLLSMNSSYKMCSWWDKLIGSISEKDPYARVESLIYISRTNIPIDLVQSRINGEYKYNQECLDLIIKGHRDNVDISELMSETNPERMKMKLEELKLKKKRKISGTLVRYPLEGK